MKPFSFKSFEIVFDSGVSAGATVELGGGIRVRHVVRGEISSLWPDALRLMPVEFGDTDLRAGLSEVRQLIDGLPERARQFVSTYGR